ncbi:hypothetical protein NIES4071_26900 [Calothrix sp. NIES-4071]|nr:hypothetical protein NIES4071_26900 [Calothrix sp. NIES-4071]BAZ57012.1 hypothetical protein NIES4105_26840 [Calothrix sp. NIES-4105]
MKFSLFYRFRLTAIEERSAWIDGAFVKSCNVSRQYKERFYPKTGTKIDGFVAPGSGGIFGLVVRVKSFGVLEE